MKNYLVTIAGDKATNDPFDGIETTWYARAGRRGHRAVIEKAHAAFVPAHPEQLLQRAGRSPAA